uniref:Minor histocompatibility protein HA-1-like n=1 Tax=Callorhinchus milii TaxID=7868 RepID=A0A4W3GKU4_CALMI
MHYLIPPQLSLPLSVTVSPHTPRGSALLLTLPPPSVSPTVQEADEMLVRCEGGVDTALLYAKLWCKYTKDLLSWLERHLALEMEFAKGIIKNAEAAKSQINQEVSGSSEQLFYPGFIPDAPSCPSPAQPGLTAGPGIAGQSPGAGNPPTSLLLTPRSQSPGGWGGQAAGELARQRCQRQAMWF